jgi:Cys-tRNA(Pro)/Cys-tRNA(Cys) deacylase
VAKKQAGGTPATVALIEAGVEHTVHIYDHDPAAASYGLEAAEAMGVDPGRVLKTLLARVDPSTGSGGGGRLVVSVVPVSGQLDLKAVAAASGGKRALMADPADAERATGYVVGGISPLGQRRTLPTVVDVTALDHPTVFVSGGRRGMEIELSPAALVAATHAVVAAIGR